MFPRRRVDLYVRARDRVGQTHVLIVESKLDSTQRDHQLSNYIELLAQEQSAASRTLVYITRGAEQLDASALENPQPSVNFRHLRWFRIYEWIQECSTTLNERDTVWRGILDELKALMEDWNMDGTISARHLRAALVYHNSLDLGARLVTEIIDRAWDESKINTVLESTTGRWVYDYPNCWQTSPALAAFGGIRISMGFRFDRRDATWNVDELELPSAAVLIFGNDPDAIERPSEKWQEGPLEGMGGGDLWAREISRRPPRYGAPVDEFYSRFFVRAFKELRRTME